MNSIKVISQLWFSEGKGNYLGMTSRKVFNIGNLMHASLWKEKMSEGWKGTTIDSHVVPHQQGHQEAVALSIRNCRKWQKTLPVSQLPCSLEAGYCQGALGRPASLQKLIICQPSCQALCWRKNDTLLILSKPHECVSTAEPTSYQNCVQVQPPWHRK